MTEFASHSIDTGQQDRSSLPVTATITGATETITANNAAHEKAMAWEFLTALDPHATKFTFQFISDTGAGRSEIFHGNLDEVWPKVEALNNPQHQYGVFVTPNETDFKGRKEKNIVRARALFVDADGPEQVEHCESVLATSGVAASAVIRTGRGAHYYFFGDVPRDAFSDLQQALIDKLGTDRSIKDLPRVMRLPGTLHLKNASQPRLVILEPCGGPRPQHSPNALIAALGASAPPQMSPLSSAKPCSTPPVDLFQVDEQVQKMMKDATDSLSDGLESGGWFERLPPDKQSNVVRHAALHIAKNSKLFELAANGGSYQDYLRLALAIARSGVMDAEDIFVAAASTAVNADAPDSLREFFEGCRRTVSPASGVTVGTLIHVANQCGANFDQWKLIGDAADPNIAVYKPGNEAGCRERLDRVVGADPNTFTLGDSTGPLVILRKPKDDELPFGAQWEGDLPGTTLATSADIMERAERLVWQKREGGKDETRLVRTHPPRSFVNDYLAQMRGRYGARPLRGIVRVPRIDDNGGVHSISGYDPRTGLFHDRLPHLDIPQAPKLDDARRMAEILCLPFSKYQFDNPNAGKALVLAAIFTALERPFLPVAPMFVVRSSMPATGKGKIVRGLVRLAFDTGPVVLTWGGSSEEFEKRLTAILLQAPAALMIDNANGMQVQGDLLESMITEGRADIRPLGHSDIVKVRNCSFMSLTGNNPIITGDMARRTIPIDIVPASVDPERLRYGFDPVAYIQQRRPVLLLAAFTAMRAFRLAGMPTQRLPAIGSFDAWSTKVRDLVCWITGYDISEVFRRNKAEDPRRQTDASLLAALYQQFGTAPFRAADAIAVHKKVADSQRSTGAIQMPQPTQAEQALHDALNDVLGSKRIDAKLFGYWARRLKGAHNGGLILEINHDHTTNSNLITVRPNAGAAIARGSPGSTGSFQS